MSGIMKINRMVQEISYGVDTKFKGKSFDLDL